MGKVMFPYTIEAVSALMGLPDNVEVIGLDFNQSRGIVNFVVSSPEYEEIPEGQELPKKTLMLALDWKVLQRQLV
jgi:hypothetical protein